MTGRDIFIIFMTFVTGFFAGVYLYITSFAPSYQNNERTPEMEEISFLLQGQKVGGCSLDSAVCPSFELRADRTYTYIPRYFISEGKTEVIEGRLGKPVFNDLVEYIDAIDDLHALEEKTPDANCSPVYDTNYRYNLIYKGEMYQYDTCHTVFKKSGLATKFYPLWKRLSTTTPQAPLLEEGLMYYLRNYLDNAFTYDD